MTTLGTAAASRDALPAAVAGPVLFAGEQRIAGDEVRDPPQDTVSPCR
jgi:hypothetical protein